MRHLKEFEEYITLGIARKQSKDIQRSKALKENSEESYESLMAFVKSVGISDKNANHIVKNAYDSIMERIRSKMAEEGYNTSGNGAHEAEVSYLRKLGFSDSDVDFADQLRYFRNGITYYGKKLDEAFAKKVMLFLEKIRNNIK